MSCSCHGATFCPDLICVGMEDDVPIFARRDSAEGYAQEMYEERIERRAKQLGNANGDPNWWNYKTAARSQVAAERSHDD